MKIQVCTWKSCKERFSEYIIKRLQWDIDRFHLDNVILENCACLWDCKQWPNVIIDGKKENFCDPIKISKIMLEKVNIKKSNKKEIQEDENINW